MKVLFVASGNSKTLHGITSIVYNQGISLINQGLEVEFFGIKGHSIQGYFKNIFLLRKLLKKDHYDVIHSHYGLCGIVAYYAHSKEKLVQSFMGSDIYGAVTEEHKASFNSKIIAFVNRYFKHKYDYCITKSQQMKELFTDQTNIDVIPNGVDFNKIYSIDKEEAKRELRLDLNKKYIVFPAKRSVKRKNFALVSEAVERLNRNDIEILAYDGIEFDKVNLYLNAGDVCMLPSFAEGSPNAIKEAMAVSIPIVATDVGDIRDLISNTEGCHICGFDSKDASDKLNKALSFNHRTTGRIDIAYLKSEVIAEKIINIYNEVLL